MGKLAKKAAEYKNIFLPRDLCEDEVNTLFARCLATEKTINRKSIPLFILNYTLTKSFEDYQLDIDSVNANRKNIEYIFGQLDIVHHNPSACVISDGIIKYDNTSWLISEDIEKCQQTLFKLYALGFALNLNSAIHISSGGKNHMIIFRPNMKPTLSPRDPNFEAWWAEHKSEWEDQPE